MPLIPFGTWNPEVHETCFVAPTAYITGRSYLSEGVTVLFGVAIRGDIQAVRVGSGTNLQEHAVLHTSTGLQDCIVGENCTIGHHGIVHGASLGNAVLVGMNAVVLDGAEVGDFSIIGANSLVPMNKKIPSGVLALGSPAKVIRELTEQEREGILANAAHYREVGIEYRKQFGAISL
jgi:carbonic anhydrase/acetyltransferase-like protein (isoleucine patch superfamily)